MPIQILRNSANQKIGSISVSTKGVRTLMNATGHVLGKYDPATNITHTKSGHKVGTGDQLSTLLADS